MVECVRTELLVYNHFDKKAHNPYKGNKGEDELAGKAVFESIVRLENEMPVKQC